MKKTILIILIFVSAKSFGQQFQWTTNKSGLFQGSEIKVIPIDKVQNKLLEYFESYDNYYDGTGYTKDGFFREFEGNNSNIESDNKNWDYFKKSIYGINELTISCVKTNLGSGSSILILIVKKDNIDVISFSNQLSRGFISTYNGRIVDNKTRFVKFYKSLIEE
jgi:hypothetical protein